MLRFFKRLMVQELVLLIQERCCTPIGITLSWCSTDAAHSLTVRMLHVQEAPNCRRDAFTRHTHSSFTACPAYNS